MKIWNKVAFLLCFISLTILSSFEFSSSLHAHHDENPFFRNSEFLIDSAISYIPVISSGFAPSIVFNGSHYFAVWSDLRCKNYTRNIFGTRLNQSGEILDSAGIAISLIPCTKNTPAVAFCGAHYLVVWGCNFRIGGDYSVYGIRIDTSGTIIDSSEFLISTTSSDWPVHPTISFGGNCYYVTWINILTSGIGSIHGIAVDTSGNVIDSSAVEIAPISSCPPSIGFDGKKFFVIYSFGPQIRGFRIDTSGFLIDTTAINIALAPGGIVSLFHTLYEDKYFVVWENNGSTQDIYCIRVDTSGSAIDTTAIPLFTGNHHEISPRSAFDGSKFFLVWEDRRTSHADIYGARVDTSCIVLDTTGIPIEIDAYDQRHPFIVSTGTQFFTAWSEESRHIGGARIDTSGVVLDSANLILSTAAYSQFFPSISTDGKNYMVVWQDKRNGEDFDIYGARIDSSGIILDQNCIPIAAEPVNQQYPKVAYSGSNYLVVWQDDRYSSIYGARIDTAGNVLEPSGFRISWTTEFNIEPSVSFDGKNYFVAWYDLGSNNELFGTRIDTSGTILDPSPIQISFNPWPEQKHRTASNGQNYLAIWLEHGINGIIVDTSGSVPDTVSFLISQDYNQWDPPSITTNGLDYFIVWQDWRNYKHDIYGARVSGSGVLIDTNGIAISTEEGDQKYPYCTFDGTDYMVLWEDHSELYTDIKGARVNQLGNVLDTFSVITQKWNQYTPIVVNGTNDQFLVTYAGFVDSISGHPANTMRIWGKIFNPPVGVDEEFPLPTQFTFALKENIPNPAITQTKITYSLSGNSNNHICLTVYNILGQQVKILVNKNQKPGIYTVEWDLINDRGEPITDGIYFFHLKSNNKILTKKLIVLR